MIEFDMKITGCTLNPMSTDYRVGYESGAKSQQAKIDLLEKELTETQAFLNKQNHIKQTKIDELQARIDKTDNLIMSFGNSIDIPLRNSLIDAIRGLKDL